MIWSRCDSNRRPLGTFEEIDIKVDVWNIPSLLYGGDLIFCAFVRVYLAP